MKDTKFWKNWESMLLNLLNSIQKNSRWLNSMSSIPLSCNKILKRYATKCFPKQLTICHQDIYLKFFILKLIILSTTICPNLSRNRCFGQFSLFMQWAFLLFSDYSDLVERIHDITRPYTRQNQSHAIGQE